MDDAHGTEPQEDRLSRLGAASLHTNESLDIDAALQAEMSSARSLTGAAAVTLNDAAQVDDPLVLDIDTAERGASAAGFPGRGVLRREDGRVAYFSPLGHPGPGLLVMRQARMSCPYQVV